jgi:hypothetical protein
MSLAIAPVLMIGFFAIMVVLIGMAAARQGKRTAENVRQMAVTLGLQFEDKPPAMGIFYPEARAAGQLRGKRVELFPFSTGSGKSRVQWCAVSAAVPAASRLTFHLRRQGFGTKLMELFGAKEIQVGDAEFDRTWFIQTNQPEFLREALLPELRGKIASLMRESGASARGMEFKLDGSAVRYAEMGNFSDPARCRRCEHAAEIVCDLADVAEVFAEQHPVS